MSLRVLYWSRYKLYRECPQRFLWRYGWEEIPARKPVVESSEHHAAMGTAIQAAVEALYNDHMYREPEGLKGRLEELVRERFQDEVFNPRRYIDWQNAPSAKDMEQVCVDGVLGYLETMKAHRLISTEITYPSPVTGKNIIGSEVKVNAKVGPLFIGGYLDMVLYRSDSGITILDGKNSKHKSKYLDPNQLRYYALAFWGAHSIVPSRLAWVWYRYPYGEPSSDNPADVEQGVQWIRNSKEDLVGLARQIVDTWKNIQGRNFEARPNPKNCRFCEFEPVCKERQAQKAANAKKRRRSKEAKEKVLEEKAEESGPSGFFKIGFD